MSTQAAPGFYRAELDPTGAERLVLRFPGADIDAAPSENGLVSLEMELRGSDASLPAWTPSLRRVEGLLVLGESDKSVEVTGIKLRVPTAIRDLEIHSATGDLEIAAGRLGLCLETESGEIIAKGAASVDAYSLSGPISVSQADVAEIRSGAGTIECSMVRHKLVAKSTSGDVGMEDCAADTAVETKSGDVTVVRPSGRVMIQTVSGDVELEAAGPFGGGDIETASGDISLGLDDTNVELRAETLSGRLRIPSGEVGTPAGPRRLAHSVGKGGRRLHAKSVSGDIDIGF